MRFSDFVEINPRTRLDKGREYPFIAMEDVMPGRRYVEANDMRTYTGGGARFQSDDILFARITPCLENGKIAQFRIDGGACGFGSTEFFVFRARPGISDSAFVYYLAVTDTIRKPAEKSMSGASGRQRADLSSVSDLELDLPPLPTQRKIAAILSAYDDLIEVNTRRIALLEEMARGLYREWFVRFRFPGHEGVRMVESAAGLTPEGWEVVALEDIAGVNAAAIKKVSEPGRINYVDISSVSPGRIDKIEPMPFTEAPGRARRLVKHGDIIWSTVRPNRKSYALILNPPPNMVVSTGFAVITSKGIPFSYLYHALTTDEFVGYLTNHATGSAYPAVNAGDFESALIVVPPDGLAENFDQVVGDMLTQQQVLHEKNANLRRTRDLLLPRLVAGEVAVGMLDREVAK